MLAGRRRGVMSTVTFTLWSVAVAGCGGALTDFAGGTAQVRFVEVAPGVPATDFYVNGTGAAYGLGYESFTSYLPVSSGSSSIAMHRSGAMQAWGGLQGTLGAGQQYTVVLDGRTEAARAHLYPDQAHPAPAGQAALRVINAMEGGASTFYVAALGETARTAATFSLGSGEAGAYLELPAGTYVVSATTGSDSLRVPVANETVKMASGAVRTVVFAGTAHGQTRRGAISFVLVDTDAPQAGS